MNKPQSAIITILNRDVVNNELIAKARKEYDALHKCHLALQAVYSAMIERPQFSETFTGNDGWEYSPEGKARAALQEFQSI